MKLQFKVDAASFNNLQDHIKPLYEEKEGEYTLKVEGLPSNNEELEHLKTKKSIAEEHRRNAEKQIADLNQQLADMQEEVKAYKTTGNQEAVERLEKSWADKLARKEAAYKGQLSKLNGGLEKALLDGAANSIAQEISNAPALLAPIIRNRLSLQESDDGFVTRVLDNEGNISADSLEDLKKAIAGDDRFAGVIIGSKGSGGGSRGPGAGGAKTKPLSEMSETERVDWYREDPVGFQAAVNQAKKQD